MSWLRSGWYQPARLALTLAYVAMIVLMLRGSWLAWKVPFNALGRMALTNYTLHSVMTSLLFYAFGYLGAFGAAGSDGCCLCNLLDHRRLQHHLVETVPGRSNGVAPQTFGLWDA